MTPKFVFLLYDLKQPALIFLNEPGPLYRNQTGGVSCYQSEERGALLPVPNYVVDSLPRRLKNYIRLSHEDADKIDDIWSRMQGLGNLTVDRKRLGESGEAWVYVHIDFRGYSGPAVLTWENSD